jgi:hypothetical protein
MLSKIQIGLNTINKLQTNKKTINKMYCITIWISPFLSSNDRWIKETTVLISSGVGGFSIIFNFSILLPLLKLYIEFLYYI